MMGRPGTRNQCMKVHVMTEPHRGSNANKTCFFQRFTSLFYDVLYLYHYRAVLPRLSLIAMGSKMFKLPWGRASEAPPP